MNISTKGINLIKKFEGFSSQIYKDSAGLPTIGYGHLITEQELQKRKFHKGITQEQAEQLLLIDVQSASFAVSRLVTVFLEQWQFDALVSFTFNVGAGALQRSTLRRKLNRREYKAIPYELQKWVWAGGRVLQGLVKRREAEAKLFSS